MCAGLDGISAVQVFRVWCRHPRIIFTRVLRAAARFLTRVIDVAVKRKQRIGVAGRSVKLNVLPLRSLIARFFQIVDVEVRNIGERRTEGIGRVRRVVADPCGVALSVPRHDRRVLVHDRS